MSNPIFESLCLYLNLKQLLVGDGEWERLKCQCRRVFDFDASDQDRRDLIRCWS